MHQQVVNANTPVKVTNPDHARHGQAGVVLAANGALNQDPNSAADAVAVRFDLADGAGARDESVAIADLEILKA